MNIFDLKPKAKEQIIHDLSRLSQEDKNINLILASSNGYKDIVKILLKNGADINTKDGAGWTPLIWAIGNQDEKMTSLLLNAKADVNIKDKSNNTPLEIALWSGETDIVKLLKKYGAKERKL